MFTYQSNDSINSNKTDISDRVCAQSRHGPGIPSPTLLIEQRLLEEKGTGLRLIISGYNSKQYLINNNEYIV